MTDAPPRWVADPGIRWRIILTVVPEGPLDVARLQVAYDALATAQGWPGVPLRTGVAAAPEALADDDAGPVIVGVGDDRLTVSAHHGYADGMGLLEIATALTGRPLHSGAAGVTERPAGRFSVEVGRRLLEVAVRTPAPVAGAGRRGPARDLLLRHRLGGSVRTARLVEAAVAAVGAHNRRHGARSSRIAVAVGAARPAPAGSLIADRSALLRLTDAERLSSDDIAARLRQLPTYPQPSGGRLVTVALRSLAPRLGSTLLVSHLGAVTAPGVAELAFYPVTAGGSGVSLGAVTVGDRTTLTLRCRGDHADAHALEKLLADVGARLS